MRRRATKSDVSIVIGALLLAGPAYGRYAPPPFHVLAGGSDLVVVGQVVRLSDSTFTLRVEEILAGSWDEEEVTALRHIDWTCSHRWKPYQLGQREIAFLSRVTGEEGLAGAANFRPMSPGDEGEWEIVGDQVSVQGFRLPAGVQFDNGEHPGQWVSLDLVRDALRYYRRAYGLTRETNGRYQIVRLVSEAAVAEYAARSFVHQYLVTTTEDARAQSDLAR